ncbi:MAG: hypothetical protein PHI85_03410 [Victivallaceae bacterium]|nr:hypothetical protein [Victivallaceae bacterium]
MNRNVFKLLAAVFAACVVSGCIDIDYVGQRLDPLPSDMPVVFFNEGQDFDVAKYAEVGRATVTAPDGTNMVEIKEKLQDEARSVGADAVKIIAFKRVNEGVIYVTGGGNDSPDAYVTGNQSRSVGGDPIYTDSFGQTGNLSTSAEPRYVVRLDVIFLALKTKFDAAMIERRQQREQSAAKAAADPLPTQLPLDAQEVTRPAAEN